MIERLKDHVRYIMALSLWIAAAQLWSGVAHAQIPTLQDVVWGSFSQTTATYPTPPGQGSRLQKTSGTTTWAGDAFSNGWISGDGYVEFRFAQNNQGAMLGLSAVNTDHTWTSVDYGIRGTSSGFEIEESGTVRTPNSPNPPSSSYTTADVFRIERLNGTVQYYKNGMLIHTSSVKSVGLLFVDTAFNQVGAAIEGVRYYGPDDVKDIWWETLSAGVDADYTVSTNAGTRLESTATAGTTVGAWGSRATIGDGYLQFRFEQINKRIGVGLSATNPDNTIDSIMYGIEATATSGQARILEPGNRTSPVFTYVASDFFRVQREDTKISYYKNDQLIAVSSVPASQGPLYPDVAFTGPGAIQNAKISGLAPTEKVVWRITSSTTASYPSGRSQLVKSTTAGWNADAVSYKAIPRDGFVRFLFGQLNRVAQVGLGGIALDVTTANTPFAIRNLGNGTVQAYENGIAVGAPQAAQLDDYFLIRRGGGKVQYIQNGKVFHEHTTSNTFSLYTHAQIYDGSGQSQIFSCEYSGVPEDVQWQNRFQTKPDYPLPGAGSKLTKTAATAAWDSDAVSTQSIAGDGYVEFNFVQTNKDIVFGLTNTDSDNGNTTLNYTIKTQPTVSPDAVRAREKTTNLQSVPYTATDVFRIQRTGSTIKYLKNGDEFYTSTVPSTGPLVVDDSFFDTNGSVQYAQVYSAPVDSDGDGIDDAWEYRYFGSLLDADQGGGNFDGDAFTNREEFEQGLDPLDYYNGVIPTIGIVSGNNQTGTQEDFAPMPLVVDVRDTASGLPLSEAPVTFAISSGTGLLSVSKMAGAQLSSALDRTTDSQTGLASAYVKQATGFGTKTFITASGGGSSPVTFMVKTDATVALWRFNDPDGSTTVADSSRGGNVGTLQGGAALTAASGFDGSKGLALNGTDAYVSVPYTETLGISYYEPFTVAGWFKLAKGLSLSSDLNVYGIVSKSSQVGPQFDVAVRGGSYKGFWVRLGTGSGVVDLSPTEDKRTSLSDGEWHHFAVVRDSAGMLTLCLDGTTVASATGQVGTLNFSTPLKLGTSTTNAFFNGTLDQISIIRDALSVTEIAALRNQDSNPADGFPDWWNWRYFQGASVNGSADADGDGISNQQEYLNETNPNDYFNGATVELTIAAGNEQMAPSGSFLDLPLTVDVHTPAPNSTGLFNAPVRYSISSGGGLLGAISGTQQLASFLDAHTINQGGKALAKAYLKLPATEGADVIVAATASSASTSFVARVSGLASRLTFNGQTGQTAQDSTGLGRTGTLLNGVVVGKGPDLSDALTFDGIDDVLSIANSTGAILPPGNASFTISFWLRSATRDTSAALLTNRAPGAASNGFSIALENGKLAIWSDDAGGSIAKVTSSRSIADVRWHKVVVTYSGSEVRMYVDGQLAATAPGQIIYNTRAICIAGGLGGWPNFAGRIDDVRFNRGVVFSAAQISSTYTGEIQSFDTDQDGLSNWRELQELHTDPELEDSDIDGMTDTQEVDAGSNPNKPGQWYSSSIYIAAGRVGHSFALEVNGADQGAVANLGLVEGNTNYGDFTSLQGELSSTSANTIVDQTTGERLAVGLANTTTPLDYRTAGWQAPGGGTPVRQYFLIAVGRRSHGLLLAQPNGAFQGVTVGPQVNSATVAPESPAARFECSAVFDPQQTFWLIDLATNEQSSANKTDLATTTWVPNTTDMSSAPAVQVRIFLDSHLVGESFTLHSRAQVGVERLQSITATTFSSVGNSWTDPLGNLFTTPANVAAVSGSVGIGMEFWLTRDRSDSPPVNPIHCVVPSTSTAGSILVWNLQGVFAELTPPSQPIWVTFKVSSGLSSYAVQYSNGTLVDIGSADLRSVDYYDESGIVQTFWYGEISAQVDDALEWALTDQSLNISYPPRTADCRDSLPPAFPAPQGWVTLDICSGRATHALQFHQSAGVTELLVRRFQLHRGIDLWQEFNDEQGNLLYALPFMRLSVPTDYDPASPNGSYFWVRDTNTGEDSAVDNLGTEENPVKVGRTDLRNWFPKTVKQLQISSSRWGHDLWVCHVNGDKFRVIQHSSQGDLTAGSDGQVLFQPYYFFDATADWYDFLNWWIEDHTTGEATENAEKLAQAGQSLDDVLITWSALPQPQQLTATVIDNASRVALRWTPNGASTDGSFRVERKIGFSGVWHDIGNVLANAADENGDFHFTDESPVDGFICYYRVLFSYGGATSAPSAEAAGTISQDDGKAPVGDEFVQIPTGHALVPIFYNPRTGRSPFSSGHVGGGGSIVPPVMGAPYYLVDKTDGFSDLGDEFFEDGYYHIYLAVSIHDQRPNTVYLIEEKKGDLGDWVLVAAKTAAELDIFEPGESHGIRYWTSGNLLPGNRYSYRIYASNEYGLVPILSETVIETPLAFSTEWELSGDGKTTSYRFQHTPIDEFKLSYRVVAWDDATKTYSNVRTETIDLSGTESNPRPSLSVKEGVFYFIEPLLGFIGQDKRTRRKVNTGILAKSFRPQPELENGTLTPGTTLFLYSDSAPKEVSLTLTALSSSCKPNGVSFTYDSKKLRLVDADGNLIKPQHNYTDLQEGAVLYVRNVAMAHMEQQLITMDVDHGEDHSYSDTINVLYSALNDKHDSPADFRIPVDEVSGARYRKIALNGRPLGDGPPETKPESDQEPEESFIDALTQGLHHSTTDVWNLLPGSDLPLAVRRNGRAEIWNEEEGLRPQDRLFKAFGSGWDSSLDANLRIVYTSDRSPEAYVTDLNGAVHRFINFVPVPTGALQQQSNLTSLVADYELVDDVPQLRWVFTAPYGTTICFEPLTTLVIARDSGAPPTEPTKARPVHVAQHAYARPLWIKDRLGNKLIYKYDDSGGKRMFPQRIYYENAPDRAITIKVASDNVVTDVWDPNGNHIQYEYDRGYAPFPPRLATVYRAGTKAAAYTYEQTVEKDWRELNGKLLEGEKPVDHFHLNLKSIENGRGKRYKFDYEFDTSREDYDSRGWYYPRIGSPRVIKAVWLPGCPNPVSFSRDGWKIRIMYSNTVTGGYQPMLYRSQGSGFAPGQRDLRVVDAEGNETTFSFDEADITRFVDPGTLDFRTATNAVSYRRMRVISAAGTETYRFDPNAGFALSESIDLSGNRTSYTYDDSTWLTSIFNFCFKTTLTSNGDLVHVIEPSSIAGKFPDPTKVTQYLRQPDGTDREVSRNLKYLHGAQVSALPQSSLLREIEDAEGRTTVYGFDEKGRRKKESIFEQGSMSATQVTEFDYDTTFPGFVRKKTIYHRNDDPADLQFDLVTIYTPDRNGNVASEQKGEQNGQYVTRHTYDRNGNRLSTQDANGGITSFSYDGRNRLTEIGYPFPKEELVATSHTSPVRKEFGYDDANNKVRERNERGYVATWEYDDLNRVKAEHRPSDAGVMTTQYGYNWVNTRISTTDPRGTVTQTIPDGIQRPRYVIAASNRIGQSRTTEFQYENANLCGGSVFGPSTSKATRIINPRGYETIRKFDTLGRLTSEKVQYRKERESTEAGFGDAAWAETIREYDDVGNLVVETDPNTNVTRYDYDALNRLTTKTFADNSTAVTKYSGTGLAWEVTNEKGKVTRTTFDKLGRACTISTPAFPAFDPENAPVFNPANPTAGLQNKSTVTEFVYDGVGNMRERTVSPGGRTWFFEYDPLNRKVLETQPSVVIKQGDQNVLTSPVLRWKYDGAGNVTETTDARSYKTTMKYDPANLKTEVNLPSVERVLPTGQTERAMPFVKTQYDLNGNVVRVESAEAGRVVQNTYTFHNELETTTDGNNIATSYQYDESGNRKRVTDGENRETEFMYDGLNRNCEIIYGGIDHVVSLYDGLSKVRQIDGNGVRTRYTYDNRNRLDKVYYIKNEVEALAYDYDHDVLGNLVSVVDLRVADGSGTVEYVYDDANHVIEEVSQNARHHYYYDQGGRRFRSIYDNTRKVDAEVDRLDRTVSLWEDVSTAMRTAGRRTETGYDLNGNIVWQKVPNGVETVTDIDEIGRIVAQTNWRPQIAGAPILISRSVTKYDLVGNVRRVEETRGSDLPGVEDAVIEMGYDYGDRLKTEKRSVAGTVQEETTYLYDNAGNCTERIKGTTPSQRKEIFGYNSRNQLRSVTDVQQGTLTTFEYDGNGNRKLRTVGEGETTYGWDEQNRLARVDGADANGGPWEYQYDYRGRRIGMKDGTDKLTRIVFSGGTSCKEYTADAVQPNGATSPNWSLKVEYVRGADHGGGVGGLLYSMRTDVYGIRFPHYNSRGDVITQTDRDAVAQWQASYEAYGTRADEAGVNPDRQRASTKEEDPTGLLNEGHRYRDRTTGTFLSRDPAGFVDGPNVYAYVRQNPWSKFDPEGLNAFLIGSYVSDPTTFNDREARRAEGMKTSAPVMVPIIVASVVAPGVGTAVAATGLSGTAATVTTAATTAAIADASGQGVEISLGKRNQYNAGRTAVAAAAGGGFGYVFQQVGKAFTAFRAVLAGEGGAVEGSATQTAVQSQTTAAESQPTVKVYRGSSNPGVEQTSHNVQKGGPLTKQGDQDFLTAEEAYEHAFHGRSYHPDGVSVTTDPGVAKGYGTHTIQYSIPKRLFDNLPEGDPALGERVFKGNIPDKYRTGTPQKN